MDKKLNSLMGCKTNEFVKLGSELYEARLGWDHRNRESKMAAFAMQMTAIAEEQGCCLIWRGFSSPCYPDKFILGKDGLEYDLDLSAIRYDGANANCWCTGRWFRS